MLMFDLTLSNIKEISKAFSFTFNVNNSFRDILLLEAVSGKLTFIEQSLEDSL